jgi:hypothetical protein
MERASSVAALIGPEASVPAWSQNVRERAQFLSSLALEVLASGSSSELTGEIVAATPFSTGPLALTLWIEGGRRSKAQAAIFPTFGGLSSGQTARWVGRERGKRGKRGKRGRHDQTAQKARLYMTCRRKRRP